MNLKEGFRFVFRYILRHKTAYLTGIAFLFLTNLVAVSIPQYLRLSIDLLRQGVGESYSRLTEYALIMVGLSLLLILVRSVSRIFFFNPARMIEHEIKGEVLGKLTRLPADFFFKNQAGALISRINNDLQGVRLACGFGFMQVFNTAATLTMTPFMMLSISPELTLYCILPIVVCFVVVRNAFARLNRHYRQKQEELQNISRFSLDCMTGIDAVQSFTMNDWANRRFGRHNRDYRDVSQKVAFIRSFFFPIFNYNDQIMRIVIVGAGGLFFFSGDLTLGDLTAMFAYVALISQPLGGFGWMTIVFQEAMVGIASVQKVLGEKEPPSVEWKGSFDATPASSASLRTWRKGEPEREGLTLTVKDLAFRYENAEKPTLESVSLTLRSGEVIGVLGEIGGGKTTLVNCLNKYLPVARGSVFLNGADVNDVPEKIWRSKIRTVTQEPFLFSDTIANNILFGSEEKPDLNEKDWERIFEESALTAEIERFADKGDTLVGEKGVMLSGGQKQRVSLARALLVPCDVLILDNVLSAVDYRTENFLLDRILERKRIQSLLIVSHRIKAMERANRILYFKRGRIVESGTHDELMALDGDYRKTWMLQNEKEEHVA